MYDRIPYGNRSGLNEPAKKRPKILIVEDDPDARSGLGQRLRHEGADPTFAADVPGAVCAARFKRPDLILLDLGLPGGDGYLAMQRIRAIPELTDIPFVVLSARDPAVERTRSLEAGAVAYFQKPIRNNELRSAIHQALEDY
jgi:two-component system KDP operon response regulator KdpE